MVGRWLIACAVAIACNLALVGWGHGDLLVEVFVLFGVFVSIIPLGIGLYILAFGGPHRMLRGWAMSLLAVGAVGVSCLPSIPLGSVVHRHDIARAKQYCEQLGPVLERYRAAAGSYPERLSEISIGVPLPRVLRGRDFYHKLGEAYGFSLLDPAAIMHGYEYSSQTGTWYEWD